MHIRPRCREWMPLATQQLRLRNLVGICGHNIACSNNSKLYFTLHYTAASDAFYTSEMVHCYDVNQPSQWAEISCPEMLKSNSNCVCVRIWERIESRLSNPSCALNTKRGQGLADGIVDETVKQQSSPLDKLIFTWGVYFSGLILINHQIPDAKCTSNSLIFQINGEHFASPEHFTTNTLREQLSLSYQRYSQSVPNTQMASGVTGDEFLINSPKVSRSSSPITVNSLNDTESADNTRINRDLLRMSKARYMELQYERSEVRKSYDLDKLLSLQEMQRLCKRKTEDAKEIAKKIGTQTVLCMATSTGSASQPLERTSFSHYKSVNSSMGRTLSVLLSQQNAIDPADLSKAQSLRKNIETLRFKQSLLQREYDKYNTRIAFLRKKLTEHHETRLKLQSYLMSRYRNLNRDKELLDKKLGAIIDDIQMKKHIKKNVEKRMSSLCRELREIYPISQNKDGLFTINNIPFPNIDTYTKDAKYASNSSIENVTPMTLSASLGYVAHLVQMIALILDRPLRNPIHHEGSRTRILDIVKDIPHTSREFPLYSRSTIPSNPVKYAIYLLNQNISQLNFDITGNRCDLRGTIENILQIFDSFNEIEQNQKDLLTLVKVGSHSNNQIDGLSQSISSIDLNNVPVPEIQRSSKPIPNNERRSPIQRTCRSVGSYSDCEDDFRNIVDHCYSNSDSKIKFLT